MKNLLEEYHRLAADTLLGDRYLDHNIMHRILQMY